MTQTKKKKTKKKSPAPRKTIRASHWKRPSTMDPEKWNAVSKAVLQSLGTRPIRYIELTDRVYPKLKNFEGALWSYILRCLRELETQGKVIRDLGPPVLYSKRR